MIRIGANCTQIKRQWNNKNNTFDKKNTMAQTAASFGFRIIDDAQYPTILIMDNDAGVSVTTDMENVIAVIAEARKFNPIDYLFIYRDKDGNWGGWNNVTKDLVDFETDSFITTLAKVTEFEKNNETLKK